MPILQIHKRKKGFREFEYYWTMFLSVCINVVLRLVTINETNACILLRHTIVLNQSKYQLSIVNLLKACLVSFQFLPSFLDYKDSV